MTDEQDDLSNDVPIESLKSDLEMQQRRYRQMRGSEAVTSDFLLGEMIGTVLPFMRDVVGYVERLEDHAEWASYNIEALNQTVSGGDDEQSSQLAQADAARFRAFFQAVLEEAEAATPSEADASKVQEKIKQAKAMLELVEEITLEPEEPEDDDDAGESDGQEQPSAAVPALASAPEEQPRTDE
ncbi:MAG: hypothetical protein GWN84_27145 [Gammaproteobacteria bacterium]|nr:hypothetical protein [Gammaproteobacteria bacterium]NIR86011.1 hypothetical protein [Gammaproteobacteria bacterium]NIU07253.1 hypothetical protein [Gammaproteobacteria bacterium]NIV54058.1 hypothetical protein [Gammaproteobacteria bacterium]NIX88526.1 hypothetical protein [Gammaproteobacteria bacterium]